VGALNGEDDVDVTVRPRRGLVLFAMRLGGDRGHDLPLLGQDAGEIYACASEQRGEQQLGRLDAGPFGPPVGASMTTEWPPDPVATHCEPVGLVQVADTSAI
jgi:hypothetical protein